MGTYIVYKTINLVNGKYYIGKHKLTGESFDGYFGSGPHIQNAVLKYGAENFVRETLFETDHEELCYLKEEEILGDLWLTDKSCYNKQPGGKGFSSGDKHYTQGQGFTDEHKKNLKKARRLRPPPSEETKKKSALSRTGLKRSEETKKRMSIAQSGNNNPMYGKKHTEEKRKEIGDKLRGKYTGEKCSSFKGWYVTPWGEFASVREAAEHITQVGRSTIKEWCQHPDKVITRSMIGISKYLTINELGKTFKDIGFYFKEK